MTIIKKLISLVFLVLLLFFSIAFIWVAYNGKTFIESRAGVLFRRPVTVEEVGFVLPLGVRITNLNVSGLLLSPEALIHFGWNALLGGAVELREVALTKPVLTLHRAIDNRILWMPDETVQDAAPEVSPNTADKNGFKAVVRLLTVDGGKIILSGHDDQKALDLFIEDVQLTAKNVPLSGQSQDATFDLKGKFIGEDIPFSGKTVKAGGTVNWPARNMDAKVLVMNDQNNSDLEVRLTSRNNDMMVEGRVKSAKAFQTGHPEDASFGNVLLGAVNASGMGLEMNFSFPTKMDRWELRNIEFSGNLNAFKSESGK